MLGKAMYFDADEFASLADYYNSEGDSEEAERLIDEGLKMHPGSHELMLMKVKVVFLEMYEEASSICSGFRTTRMWISCC